MRVRIRRRNLQGKENIREEGAEAARTGHVGVHCVGHFPLPARAEEGAPGWSLRGFAALFSGRAWHLRVPAWDRGVSGFGGLLEQLGRMKAKKKMEATDAACRPRRQGSGLMRNTLLQCSHVNLITPFLGVASFCSGLE